MLIGILVTFWMILAIWLGKGRSGWLVGTVILCGWLVALGVWVRRWKQRMLPIGGETASPVIREYLSRFFDQLPVGALILDPEGHVQHCNRRALELLGLPEEALREANWHRPDVHFLTHEGTRLEAELGPTAIALGSRERVENQIVGLKNLQGSITWLSVTVEPRLDFHGAVQDLIVILEDVTQRRFAEAELMAQSLRDPLTGLPNRALLQERIAQALVRNERRHLSVSVLFLDLDRFKLVNDSLSHEQGDQLLVQVARRLKQVVRPEDTVARLGGDEFAVLLEDVSAPPDAFRVAERIQKAFELPFKVGEHEIFTTCSMGITVSSDASMPPSSLVRDSEVAMYRAKAHAKGEGGIELFDPSMNAQAMHRLQMEAELRRGLERGEFLLNFQPVVGLVEGRIEGWEALVRWKHPERGMVPPLEFIGMAEENGMIVPLGRWVLEEACRVAATWHQAYPCEPPRLMNVNISARQFQARDLIETVTGALQSHGMPPRLLKLEITESVMMQDPKASVEAMRIFKTLNIHLVIDDFGTGYSSLAYLKRFPVDTLKIDKSFVDGLGQDPEDTVIVQAVISLAKSLGMKVVAEGIETAEQLAMLRAMGCDQGQGYYFSRPLPPDQAEALLQKDPVW